MVVDGSIPSLYGTGATARRGFDSPVIAIHFASVSPMASNHVKSNWIDAGSSPVRSSKVFEV
jgi:hypothetical protein